MKHNKTLVVKLALLLGGLVVLVLAVGGYVHRVSTLLERDTQSLLGETALQNRTIIREKLDSDFALLQNVADQLSELEDVSSPEAAALLAKQASRMPEGIRLLSVTLDGRMADSDGRGGVVNMDLLNRVVKEGRIISDVEQTDLEPDQKMIALSLPIVRQGQVIGGLSCRYNTSLYEELVTFSVYSGQGQVIILKPTGERVIWRKNDVTTSNWTRERVPELDALFAHMQAGETGTLRGKDRENGTTFYLSYLPLEINDWYLLTSIPGSALLKNKIAIRSAVLVATTLTGLIVAALTFVFLRLDRKQKQQVENLSLYDRLTGIPNLPNIQKFYESLTQKDRRYAFVLVKVNFFEHINELFGYDVGGQVLKSVSDVLTDALKEGESAARISEDYFALLLHQAEDETDFSRRMDRLLTQLEQIPVTDGTVVYDYQCSYTGGVYLLTEEQEEFSEAFRKADLIIEHLPEREKSSWRFFDQPMADALTLQNTLTMDILKALKERQFIPYFQPQYNLRTREVVGAEVLARWNHPQQGLLLPGQFLPVLELAGCVLELDMLMLEAACRQLKEWLDQGLMPVPLSVNLSQLNLHRKDFFSRVQGIVKKYQVPANLLALEMSAVSVSDNSDRVPQLADSFKSQGFLLSVDNFGEGGSSLELLRNFPMDVIKLERNFLSGEDILNKRGETVLSNIRNMIRGLGAILVVEGVETQEQEDFIRHSGAEIVQGFLYGAPMSDVELSKCIFTDG